MCWGTSNDKQTVCRRPSSGLKSPLLPPKPIRAPDAISKLIGDHMASFYKNVQVTLSNKPDLLPYAFYSTLWCLLAIFWLKQPFSVGVGDWDWVFSDAFQSANGLLERGWFPFWTIQTRGGAPLAGNPESISQSPFLFLLIAAGSIVGIKLLLLWLVGLGMLGCHVLGKQWFHDPWAAAGFTFVFIFSGYFAIHLRVGHFMWAMFFLVPWILYFVDRMLFAPTLCSRDMWGLLVTIVFFMFGPVYHSLMFFLIPVLLCYMASHAFKVDVRRLRLITSIFILALIIALPRIIAIAHWELSNPRHTSWSDKFSILDVFKMLLTPIDDYNTPAYSGNAGIWEYWAFIGIFSCILAAIGILSRERWKWFALCLLVVGVIISLSNERGIAFFALFRGLPILSSVRMYSRFLILIVFGIALLVGGSITVIRCKTASYQKLIWAWLLFFFVVVDYFLHVIPIWTKLFPVAAEQVYNTWSLEESTPPYSSIMSAPAFQESTKNGDRFDSRMFPLMKAKMIIRNAYTGVNLPPFSPSGDKVIEWPQNVQYAINNHQIKLYGDFWPGQSIKLNLLYHAYWKSAIPETVSVENDGNLMRLSIQQACTSIVIKISGPWEKMVWMISPFGILGMMLIDILWLRKAASG
jgi:hypothetical protein